MKQTQALFAQLASKIAAVETQTAPLRAKRDALAAKIAPVEAEMRKLAKEARDIEEAADLFSMKNEHAALARALGGKRMSDAA